MTPESSERPTADDKLSGRFLVHLEELQAQQASFDRVAARLDQDGFVAAWTREGTPEQDDDKGALERACEQIVNELQEMLDDIERRGAAKGVLPAPDAAISAWWHAADELGFETAGAKRSERPGRWRRLAFYGFIDHDLANALKGWSDPRNLFQHGYLQRNAPRGGWSGRAWKA